MREVSSEPPLLSSAFRVFKTLKQLFIRFLSLFFLLECGQQFLLIIIRSTRNALEIDRLRQLSCEPRLIRTIRIIEYPNSMRRYIRALGQPSTGYILVNRVLIIILPCLLHRPQL